MQRVQLLGHGVFQSLEILASLLPSLVGEPAEELGGGKIDDYASVARLSKLFNTHKGRVKMRTCVVLIFIALL